MDSFLLNGRRWRIRFVDASSPMLVDRTSTRTVATTDPGTGCVYISNDIRGEFLLRVLLHELGHCAMVSFNLLYDIHKMVKPRYWVEAEEWVCNFIADYGMTIFSIAYSILGYEACKIIPEELERFIA